jgi:hypothetical protein
MLDRHQFISLHPEVIKAQLAITEVQERMLKNNRWGEARRFAGRSAGIRLEQLDKARERLSKAIDKANNEYKKECEL